MTSQVTSPSPRRSFQEVMDDTATDSGYGGSIADDSSITSENILERKLSDEEHFKHRMPTSEQQEIYRENCQRLISSIEDTKSVLKVPLIRGY